MEATQALPDPVDEDAEPVAFLTIVATSRVFMLTPGSTTVGRAGGPADVQIESKVCLISISQSHVYVTNYYLQFVSVRHARIDIDVTRGHASIADLGSTTRTYVNKRALSAALAPRQVFTLHDGQKIWFGECECEFAYPDSHALSSTPPLPVCSLDQSKNSLS